jgi:hypothetical protein
LRPDRERSNPENLGRITRGNHVVRNIPSHNRASADDGAGANLDPGHDERAGANERVFSYGDFGDNQGAGRLGKIVRSRTKISLLCNRASRTELNLT